MLIIIGIISVMVIGRGDVGLTDLPAQTEVIKSHIRYTQSRSMNADRTWGIHCDDDGQAYWLFVDGDPDNESHKRKLPGEASETVDLSRYQLALTPTTLSFDDRGRPCSDAEGKELLTGDLILTLSAGAGATTTIVITRNTGFVP
ncbi:cleavage protein [Desulfosarcina alkanivorans]|uniref:Cleavage protein n=1 Tax=Desulfosarcina alkanivorans TaxID=571177 RepID=A0A5K7YQU2_9BACT|nr:cleavage protein [Desulfosarcina alkanivorans]